MIGIILADDHQVIREALRLLLESQPDFNVLAEAGDGFETLELVKRHKPDILVLDLMLPGLSGSEVARRTKTVSGDTKVIILSMQEAETYVVEALQAGVAGYVLKKSSSGDLILAIRQALAGSLYLSPGLNEQAIREYLQQLKEPEGRDPYGKLTPREREIFHLAAEGLSNGQIAERLSLSARTVEMHRSHLMKKLRLKSHIELIKYAVERGMVWAPPHNLREQD